VLTEEELDKITYRCGTGDQDVKIISTNLLKLKPYKTMVVHKLQGNNSANRINFCNELRPRTVQEPRGRGMSAIGSRYQAAAVKMTVGTSVCAVAYSTIFGKGSSGI
jgi:hypothetical protein